MGNITSLLVSIDLSNLNQRPQESDDDGVRTKNTCLLHNYIHNDNLTIWITAAFRLVVAFNMRAQLYLINVGKPSRQISSEKT